MRTISEIKEDIMKWNMLIQNHHFMIKETEERIALAKRDLKKVRPLKTKEGQYIMSVPEQAVRELENLKKQLMENHAAAPGMIKSLEKELRDTIKAEQIEKYSQTLKN